MRARIASRSDPDAACTFNASSTASITMSPSKTVVPATSKTTSLHRGAQPVREVAATRVRCGASTLPCATAGHSHANAASRSRKRIDRTVCGGQKKAAIVTPPQTRRNAAPIIRS